MLKIKNVSPFVREVRNTAEGNEWDIEWNWREWRPWVWVVLVTAMLWGLMKMWILATVMQYH